MKDAYQWGGFGLFVLLVADIEEKKAEKEGRQVKQRKRGEMGRGAVVIV